MVWFASESCQSTRTACVVPLRRSFPPAVPNGEYDYLGMIQLEAIRLILRPQPS